MNYRKVNIYMDVIFLYLLEQIKRKRRNIFNAVTNVPFLTENEKLFFRDSSGNAFGNESPSFYNKHNGFRKPIGLALALDHFRALQ